MLRLYNSLTRRMEDFQPLKGKTVTMYNCGPTVYDRVHIGNLRTYLFADTLRRTLEACGYKVKQVVNITDVGHALGDADVGRDKVEEGAKREGLSPSEVARKYEELFFDDIRRLGLEPAYKYPRASEHVEEMVGIIKKLLSKGFAYEAGGDVYFDISKFPAYGSLSGNKIEALAAGARVEANPKKKHPFDFALWINNPRHLMQWEAPWGRGYPGWHIECSAMSMKYLGESVDIHTGAEDNKFPHHECEIAQSEGATGNQFVRYWVHARHLLVDGAKMAKSMGNFYTLDDLLAKGYEPREVRYALIASHYRDQQNFTLASLDAAKSAIAKLDKLFERLSGKGDRPLIGSEKGSVPFKSAVDAFERDFSAAMDDDLNVPKALGHLFVFVKEASSALDQDGLARAEAARTRRALEKICGGYLGIELKAASETGVPKAVKTLLDERENARKAKDFAKADALREKIKAAGFLVEDSPEGARLKKI